MRNDDSLATILLVSRIAKDGAVPLKASEFWKLVEQVPAPGDLLSQTKDDLIDSGLTAEVAGRMGELLGRATAMAFQLERLDQSGIATLTPFDDFYPQRLRARLGSKAPAILHVAGALELLNEPGIGVVGSRNVSQKGAEVARLLGRCAASLGVPLVSGAARGVDQLAMDSAFQAGGTVVGIPAQSLIRTLRAPDVRRAVYGGRTVVCTPYAPNSPFSVVNAMGRNKLIYALSAVTVAVAADRGSGGTWSGATEALKGNYCRVAVWRGSGEGPGNEALEQKGALPVASVNQVNAILSDPQREKVESPHSEQTALF